MNSERVLQFHPLANIFPLIMGPEFEALTADIGSNGLQDKIVMHEGMILDGRNRYRACVSAKTMAADVEWAEDRRFITLEEAVGFDPETIARGALRWVMSKNLHRRHLDESQRAMIAARLSNLVPGRPAKAKDGETPSIEGVSTFEAAELLSVGKASVERARTVQRKGSAELVEAVDRGQITVSVAAHATKLDPAQQAKVIEAAAAGDANVMRTVLKRAMRTEREQELGKKQRELPDKQYGVILADPEWEFVVFSRTSGLDRAADNHYPTSSEKTIAARDVQKISAKDCLLLLWTTDLARGIRVMESWGFAYKSYRVWVKDIVEVSLTTEQRKATGLRGKVFNQVGPAGTGFWNVDRDEILLIGTRGEIPCPSPGTQGESVIFAARPKQAKADRGKHSAKPPDIHEWVETHYPNLPKIELNARGPRAGWDTWGFEAPDDDITAHDPETGEVIEDEQQESEHDEDHGEEGRAAGDEGSAGEGDHEDKRGLHLTSCERVEQEGDCDSPAGGDEDLAEGHHDGAGRAAATEGLVLPVRDGPEPIGLYVGGKFVATRLDASPAEQFVEQRTPPTEPEPMEIPSFLRRHKTAEGAGG